MNATGFSIRKFFQLLLAGLTVLIVVTSSCVPVAVSQPQPFARDLAHQIQRTYGIVLVDRSAHWAANEAHTIWRALERLAYRIKVVFGVPGESTLKALLDGSVFYRDGGTGDKIAYTIAGTVSFYDVWGSYDDAHRMFYLYHEVGHLLDARGSLMNLFMGEISGMFSGRVGSYLDDRGQYQLGADFPQPADQPIRHRTDSANEDWAETFASVLMPEFENELRDVGTPRQMEVVKQFSNWLAQQHRERPKEQALADSR
ncbi:MAG: hypothetical protein HY870_16580 [Chloroflexi bacterium]|nr:hypothetical protein [Chloroflexota bacterium]